MHRQGVPPVHVAEDNADHKEANELRIMYFFGGEERHSELRRAFQEALEESGSQRKLVMDEIDVLRQPGFDVKNSEVQKLYQCSVVSGRWDLIIVSPPIGSFSRAAFAGHTPAKPVRDRNWLRGFPWLEGETLEKASRENCLMDFLVRILEFAGAATQNPPWRQTRGWLEHPEDLGTHKLGDPASLWQWQSVKDLASQGYERTALHQCNFDAVGYAKPTGVLSSIPEWNSLKTLHHGWPNLELEAQQGDCKRWQYKGPLPNNCGHHEHPREDLKLVKGAYGRNLCKCLAKAVWEDFSRRLGVETPMEGISKGKLDMSSDPSGSTKRADIEDTPRKSDAVRRIKTMLPSPKIMVASSSDSVLLPSAAEIAEEATKRSAVTTIEDPDTDADEDAAPVGAGWTGHGPKISVGKLSKRRDFIDGGGLCSPGLWLPENRRLPVGTPCKLREWMLESLKQRSATTKKPLKVLLAELVGGKIADDPFPEEMISEIRDKLKNELARLYPGMPTGKQPGDRDQPIQVRLLSVFLKACEDPDWKGMLSYCAGIRYGVAEKLPRTPAVFPPKRKWRLEAQQKSSSEEALEEIRRGYEGTINSNYNSATIYPKELDALLDKKVASGRAFKLSMSEARKRYGKKLTVASLGALVKSTSEDKQVSLRLLFDGTNNVDVNPSIHVRDQQQNPTAADLKTMLRAQAASGSSWFGLSFDIDGAHENIPVHREDWPLQAVRGTNLDELYVSMFALFGVASISYWWARLAAALLRILHYVLGRSFAAWLMVFADDFMVNATGRHFVESLLLCVLTARLFGFPIQWAKSTGGFTFAWIGLEVSLAEHRLGISERRAAWMEGWYSKVLDTRSVLVRDMRDALGRMAFVYGALAADRPFLGPLYAYVAVTNLSAVHQPPLFVMLIIKWLRKRLRERRSANCSQRTGQHRECFRIDAKAEGREVRVGGWEPNVPADLKPNKQDSRWFSVTLDEVSAPWAYSKGEPYKTIAALELLATTIAVLLFGPEKTLPADGVACACVTGHTDSMVTTHAVVRGLSTSYPLCIVAMELAAQLEARGAELHLMWAPRTHNQEADDLSNAVETGFDPAKRVEVSALADLPWLVLPEFMEEGRKFFDEIKEAKRIRREEPGTATRKEWKRAKHTRLRNREPW